MEPVLLIAPFNARPIQDAMAISGRAVALNLPCVRCECGWSGRGGALLHSPDSPYWYCPRCSKTFWRWW